MLPACMRGKQERMVYKPYLTLHHNIRLRGKLYAERDSSSRQAEIDQRIKKPDAIHPASGLLNCSVYNWLNLVLGGASFLLSLGLLTCSGALTLLSRLTLLGGLRFLLHPDLILHFCYARAGFREVFG
jgi:hypothetical protein